MGQIRETLLREKELDIANVKRTLQEEKDAEIAKIKSQLHRDSKSQLSSVHDELMRQHNTHKAEIDSILRDIQSLVALYQETQPTPNFEAANSDLMPFDKSADWIKSAIARLKRSHEDREIFTSAILNELHQSFGISTSLSHDKSDAEYYTNAIKNAHKESMMKLDEKDRLTNTLQEKVQSLADYCSKAVEEAREQHKLAEERLVKSHLDNVVSLKASYEAQITKLVESLNSKSEPPSSITLASLLERYPNQLDEYREIVTKTIHEKLFSAHQHEIRSLQDQHHRERADMAKGFKSEIARITKDVKEQCSIAYENAIRKLQEEYSRMEERILERYRRDSEMMKADKAVSEETIMKLKQDVEKLQVCLPKKK
jgi:hypothetical protein